METDKNRDWALDNEPPMELDNAVNFLNSRKHLQKNGEIDRYAVGRIMLEWASQNASTIESKLPVGSVVKSLHICKHCGVETFQPDEECYKAPKP